jgi:hypothetical protein
MREIVRTIFGLLTSGLYVSGPTEMNFVRIRALDKNAQVSLRHAAVRERSQHE